MHSYNTDSSRELTSYESIIVNEGLPPSHQVVSVPFGGRLVQGVVWGHEDVMAGPHTFMAYKKWAEAHFGAGGFWYQESSRDVTNLEATTIDVDFIHEHILGNNIDQTVIDESCGPGRHSLLLAQRGVRTVIGMEPVAEQLRSAQAQAQDLRSKGFAVPIFVDTSPEQRALYAGQADVVLFLFNSLGYTFNADDDQARLQGMANLLKPGGTLAIDVRSYEYQKRHYSDTPIMRQDAIRHEETDDVAYMTTTKYCPDDVLIAVEHIQVGGRTAQYMTYGWQLYNKSDLTKRIEATGCSNVRIKYDRYLNGEVGERVWFIATRNNN